MRGKPAPPPGALPGRYRAREAACTPSYGTTRTPIGAPRDAQARAAGVRLGEVRHTKPETYFRFLPTSLRHRRDTAPARHVADWKGRRRLAPASPR